MAWHCAGAWLADCDGKICPALAMSCTGWGLLGEEELECSLSESERITHAGGIDSPKTQGELDAASCTGDKREGLPLLGWCFAASHCSGLSCCTGH